MRIVPKRCSACGIATERRKTQIIMDNHISFIVGAIYVSWIKAHAASTVSVSHSITKQRKNFEFEIVWFPVKVIQTNTNTIHSTSTTSFSHSTKQASEKC